MRRRRSNRPQRGQAAVEWVLTLPILILLIAVLYQALMFERDVFNKMNLMRYEAFKRAHEGQNVEGMAEYSILEVRTQGETLANLTGFVIPSQTVDTEHRYGPKTFYFPCGTKRFFPGGDTGETILDVFEIAAVIVDHYETTAKFVAKGAEAIGKVGEFASAVPCEDASEAIGELTGVLDEIPDI